MSNHDESNTGTVLVITHDDVARAHAKAVNASGDADHWDLWSALEPAEREHALQFCKYHLARRAPVEPLLEEGHFSYRAERRWEERTEPEPAQLRSGRQIVSGTPTLACVKNEVMEDWYMPVNPRNKNVTVEAGREDWVQLAKAIQAGTTESFTRPEKPATERRRTPGNELILVEYTHIEVALATPEPYTNPTQILRDWEQMDPQEASEPLECCRRTVAAKVDWEELLQEATGLAIGRMNGEIRKRVLRNRTTPGLIFGGGSRLAIRLTDGASNRYEPYSPRNENAHGEGKLEHWQKLASEILMLEARAQQLQGETN